MSTKAETEWVSLSFGQRQVWYPEFETRVIETHGRDWPEIIVTKWEVNTAGERRIVGEQVYTSAKVQET